MFDWAVSIMLGIGILGILGVLIWMGFLTQNKDNGANIKIQLGIVAGVTAVLVLIFAIASYMYFTANINYLTPFLLWMTFFNIFLSTFAVSVSTIQVVNV